MCAKKPLNLLDHEKKKKKKGDSFVLRKVNLVSQAGEINESAKPNVV